LNNEEEVSAQCVQEWLKEIGLFFQSLNDDNQLTAYLKDQNFTEEQKANEFTKRLNVYCRKLKQRTDISDAERLVKLLKDNNEQLRARYTAILLDAKDEPDYDFDTTPISMPSGGTMSDELIAQIEQLFNPTYNETNIKTKLKEVFALQFEFLCGKRYRKLDEVIDAFFDIVKAETIEDLDGLNESVPDYLNKFFFAKNNPIAVKNIFKNLLLDLEPFLRKICYLKNNTLFDQYAGFVDVVKEIYDLKILYYTDKPELAVFKSFYNSIYQWRNDNAHKAPVLPDNEVPGAIHMVLAIYLYATMVSITDIEANSDIFGGYNSYTLDFSQAAESSDNN
jgi:hypothetical protein